MGNNNLFLFSPCQGQLAFKFKVCFILLTAEKDMALINEKTVKFIHLASNIQNIYNVLSDTLKQKGMLELSSNIVRLSQNLGNTFNYDYVLCIYKKINTNKDID